MRRRVSPELLDSDAGTPAEVQASLADLRLVNRWFGGASTMGVLVDRVAERTGVRHLSLLDVAGASGDIPQVLRRRLARRGVRLEVVVLDRTRSHLNGSFPAVVADALALPFADRSFDLVACSLFLHHLEPPQITALATEALRVSRLAFLANDLRRSPAHLALVYAGFPLYRSRITRHDAPLSIRRAYTLEEIHGILNAVPAAAIEISTHYLYRFGVVAWQESATRLTRPATQDIHIE